MKGVSVSPHFTRNVFVITEATSRTGFFAARAAAEFGGEVLLLDRNFDVATDSIQKLKNVMPHGTVRFVECDMQDSKSVRRAINEIKSEYSKLYCLAHGAGDLPTQEKKIVDGIDSQKQNYLSHILLTTELLPLLKAQANEVGDARIVNHSSLASLYTLRENESICCSDVRASLGRDEFRPYLKSKFDRSALRFPTAFKKHRNSPGAPLLALAPFVRIKLKGSSPRSMEGSISKHLVYSGIF